MKKEIAFIDHNFHKKSRSADFLRKIFEKKYKIKNFDISNSYISDVFGSCNLLKEYMYHYKGKRKIQIKNL